jgi:hypothetical protein
MNGFRKLLPLTMVALLFWWACDGRTLTQSTTGGDGGVVASVEVSTDQSIIYYSQSSRTAVSDTISVLVLDEDRTAMSGVDVACEVQSSFGGGLEPLTARKTDDTGVARYVFRVLPSDDPFTGEQAVTFRATAGNKTGTAGLTLMEQSDIQLQFLSPADGSVLYRMADPAETMPVQVYAYRDVDNGETTQRVGVSGVQVNFSVSALGQGLPGTITVAGTTGSDGVTQNVFYANSSVQPADTTDITFTAAIAGSATVATSHVDFVNHFGQQLVQILPQTVNLRSSILCADSTAFVFQFKDRYSNPVAGARFNVLPSMGSLLDDTQYTLVSDEGGLIRFAWRSCEAEGGNLTLSIENVAGRTYYYTYPVADARPVELTIISPAAGSELEVDSECIEDNQVPIRARLRYADNNNPIVGRTVSFSANLGEIGSVAATNSNGIAEVMWHDCDETDSGSELDVTAAFYNGLGEAVLQDNIQYDMTLPLGVPNSITVSVANNTLPDPNTGDLESLVTATVFNAQNQRLGAGLAIGFRTNGIGTVTAAGFTNEQGVANATFAMNNSTGIGQILAYYARPNTTPAETLWSAQPATVTVNSGLPANVTLSTTTPRIQILGYGSQSAAQIRARVVDAQGATVTFNTPVRFTIENGPEEVFLSIPGQSTEYFQGDTLTTTSQNGIASMTLNAGRRPGPVQIGCFVEGEGYEVYSNGALVTILAGPPAYGSIDYDGVGNMDAGAGIWRVEWSVHLWDQYSNDVEDSTAVWFHLAPENVCSFEGFGLTGVSADGEEGFPGIAGNWMQYHCSTIGDTLLHIIATAQGVVPDIGPFGDTTWVSGEFEIDYVAPGSFFQIPFQAGDRDDNLTISSNVTQINFPMEECDEIQADVVPVQARLIDGYGCQVKNQVVCFQADFNFPWLFFDEEAQEWVEPDQPFCWTTNDQGVINALLLVDSSNMGIAAPCPEELGDGCYSYTPQIVNYGAGRQPGGWPASNQLSVQLTRECQLP